MSYDDVGKAAKRNGVLHVSHARKLDPVPEKRPPGAAKPHRKVEKLFGYSYEYNFWWRAGKPWKREFEWFETEAARDQSMRATQRKIQRWEWYRDLRIEARTGSAVTGGDPAPSGERP